MRHHGVGLLLGTSRGLALAGASRSSSSVLAPDGSENSVDITPKVKPTVIRETNFTVEDTLLLGQVLFNLATHG